MKRTKRTVVVNRTRFVFSLIIGCLLVNIFIWNVAFSRNIEADMKDKSVFVTVGSGDTLWDIAEEYCKDYDDVRKWVYEIKQVNSLKSSDIYQGQVLEIPII